MQQGDAVVGVDAHQHDRLVAGKPEAPELPLVHRPALGSHARCAVHQRGGEILQRQDLLRHQPQVAYPNLRQRGGHPHGSLDVHRLLVAVDASRKFVLALGSGRRKGQPRHRAGRQSKPHAQAGDRVQAVDGGRIPVEGLGRQCRRRHGPIASAEGAAVGDAIHQQHLAFGSRQKMGGGDFRIAVQARPSRHHQRPPLRLPAGLDKQVGKGRMRFVGLRCRQHRLETGD